MMEKEFQSLGIKDMHPMQVEALMEFISIGINLASMIGDPDILDDVTAYADEMVKLFGGNGVKLTVEVDT